MASPRTQTSPNPAAMITTTDSYQTPSLSVQLVANNDDLLTEILLCLPINSLLKFKSVSKHWRSIISSPNFFSRRTPFPNSATGLFAMRYVSFKPYLLHFISLQENSQLFVHHNDAKTSLTFLQNRKGKILQSSNGLLLVRTPVGSSDYPVRNSVMDFFISNPTTKQYTKLPRPSVCAGYSKIRFLLNLAFDPSKSPYYKVVCLRGTDTSNQQYQIEIYSSETRRWKLSGGAFDAPFDIEFCDHGDLGDCVFCNGVFCNGAINWITRRDTLLYFDVEEEQLKEMELPFNHQRSINMCLRYFGESRDHLHLIEMFKTKTKFDVYEMERDYSNWFVKYRVDLDEVIEDLYPRRNLFIRFHERIRTYSSTVISIVRCEVEEESYMVLHISTRIIAYYFNTNTFKKLHDTPITQFSKIAHPYIESFAPV